MTTQTSHDHLVLTLPAARVDGGKLQFESDDDSNRALRIGAFNLQIPADLDPGAGLEFCRSFYQPATDAADRQRGHREHGHPESKLGYEDRPDQVEQLQLENFLWSRYLPDRLTTVLRKLEQLTQTTLDGVFDAAGISKSDREVVTGGIGGPLCYTTVNHYRAGLTDRAGIVEHSDSGFITTICTDQPGYEILHDGNWMPVRERAGHFIVNLGDAFEVLTANYADPVSAVYHRVPELRPDAAGRTPDRSSFTIYMGPRYDMDLYQYDADGTLQMFQGFREFSVEKAGKLGYDFHSRI
ncbi:2OG-Fe(II) oxygenase family protein [Williamsia herbipolensis]|uniref:2OG-Fe(II) oxygenase family protein n=1 Tax=Williamsia herbipolensis TaxID=1603258 RepID=UPI0009E3B9FC|nr:2OG-Fe(II) oxygenase family protein [Williamsia herbipolensis]